MENNDFSFQRADGSDFHLAHLAAKSCISKLDFTASYKITKAILEKKPRNISFIELHVQSLLGLGHMKKAEGLFCWLGEDIYKTTGLSIAYFDFLAMERRYGELFLHVWNAIRANQSDDLLMYLNTALDNLASYDLDFISHFKNLVYSDLGNPLGSLLISFNSHLHFESEFKGILDAPNANLEDLSIVVVAARWDRLGGRLSAMINAVAVATMIGANFRFVWPRGKFLELDDPTELFSSDFVNCYEMTSKQFESFNHINASQYSTIQELKQAALQAKGKLAIVVKELQLPIFFDDQTVHEAQSRFRSASQFFQWSRVIDDVVLKIKALEPDFRDAFHLRAGDFIQGIRYGDKIGEDWTSFLPVEKYLPMDVFSILAQKITATGNKIIIFSDNAEAVKRIQQEHVDIYKVTDIFPEFDKLSEAQQALFEIFLMSRMERIFAPPSSAFSRLSAALGQATLITTENCLQKHEYSGIIQNFLMEPKAHQREIDRLLSRDACWFLDVFYDELDPNQIAQIIKVSENADPYFCHSKNWLSISCTLARDQVAFEKTSADAMALATKASSIHHDPLVETISIEAASQLFLSIFDRSTNGNSSVGWTRYRDSVTEALETLSKLRPHQISIPEIIMNLCFQRTLILSAERRGINLTKFIEEILCNFRDLHTSWRDDGINTMPERFGLYPSVLRKVETFTILLATAVNNSLSVNTTALVRDAGSVETIRSPTGLTWLYGHLSNQQLDDHNRLFGVAIDGKNNLWGVTLTQNDVKRFLAVPVVHNAGVLIPVTRDIGDKAMRLVKVL
jgi:hypothetical protein